MFDQQKPVFLYKVGTVDGSTIVSSQPVNHLLIGPLLSQNEVQLSVVSLPLSYVLEVQFLLTKINKVCIGGSASGNAEVAGGLPKGLSKRHRVKISYRAGSSARPATL